MVTTIVTTNMTKPITEANGVKLIEVLTGFKFIGEQIKFFEQTGSNNYVFGLEESYGCLAGTHARDKDAVVAVMCLCEVAAYCKKHNMTLWDMMVSMYEKYGYFKETQYTITMKGIDGARQIAEIMDKAAPKKKQNQPKVNIIYEDENIAVLYKPTHLLCHSDRTGDANLVDAFTQYLAEKGE